LQNPISGPVSDRAISRRDALRILVGGGAALAAGPSLLAQSASAQTTARAKGNLKKIPQLNWGNGSFTGLDPASSASNFTDTATAPALEALIGFTPELKIMPILAESYKHPDVLRYVYKIRKGVKFWDGSELTAQDVSYSLNRQIDPKVASQLATYFVGVKSIKVTGPMEVTVTLSAPNPEFQYVPALVPIFPEAFIKAQGKKLGTPSGSTATVMGTGPMQITSFTNSGVKYEAFAGYWGEPSHVEKLNLVTFLSANSARLAFESGDIDGTFFGVTGDTIPQWTSVSKAKLQSSTPMNISYLALNTTLEPFDDVHARRALAYATDTQGFLKAFLKQAGEAPTSILPPAYFANLASPADIEKLYKKIPQYPFNLDKAKSELAQSKYPNGFTVQVPYTTQIEGIVEEVLVSMSTTLQSIGITFTPQPLTIGAWADLHQQNNSPILWGYWLPDYPDPADVESLFFPSAGAVPHRNNSAHWKVPAVDALLNKQAHSLSSAGRAEDLGRILELAGEQMPYLPLWWERSVIAVNSGKVAYSDFSPLFYDNNWLPNIAATA
jgi:peptide/nickel transport system substrate-binding protein